MNNSTTSNLTSGTLSWEEIGHENISMTIISLPLIQEGRLSGTGEMNVH